MARKVKLCETEYEFPSAQLQVIKDSSPALNRVDAVTHQPLPDWDELRRTFQEDGYLYLSQALRRDDVLAARARVMRDLVERGSILDPDRDPTEGVLLPRCGLGCLPFLEGKNAITHSPEVHDVIAGERLKRIMTGLLGEDAITFDYKWLRAMPRKAFTGCHLDRVYMARGSQRLVTCWIPFDDASLELGALAVCEGSHRLPGFAPLQRTYGEMDVERDALDGTGWFTNDPREIARMDAHCTWRTTDYRAGDVVLFGMRTVHASTANATDRVRISCDVRWQPAAEPVDERYVGADVSADARVKSGAWKTEAAPAAADAAPAAPAAKVTIEQLRTKWGFDAPASTTAA